MDVVNQVVQFVLSLSFLIILHEMGHFIPARLFKTRVEKFYLFFNPWFSLFKKKIGDTEYGIGWLPLGGYVKISGMIDESMDKEQMKQPPKDYEFRSKPAWQRLIIMLGGVTVNFILGIIIFAMVLFAWGKVVLPAENAVHGVVPDSIGLELGLLAGDKLVSINNEEISNLNKINYDIIIKEAQTIEIDRNGEQISLSVPEGTINKIIKTSNRSIVVPRFLAAVDSVMEDSPAEEAGLEKGDQIVSFTGVPVRYLDELDKVKSGYKNETVDFKILRDRDTLSMTATLEEDGTLGFYPVPLDLDTVRYGFFASFPAGLREAWVTLNDYVTQIKLIMFSPEIKASESVGGFISIGKIFAPSWDWHRFWFMTAWLSLILAFMNLLPIPALDGGHVMFLLYEVVTGKKPADKFMEYAQVVGMILILALLVFANANDIIKLFR